MRILLDECVPKGLKRSFRPAHQALTVADAGWGGLKNGALLQRVAEQFEVFVTVDGSIRHQQRLEKYQIVFVLLEAVRNDIVVLEPLVPRVLEALATAKPGDLIVIGG